MSSVPEEELAKTIKKVSDIKCLAFDEIKYFVRGDMQPKICGYKSIEDAAVKIITKAVKDCEIEYTLLEKKYPNG